MGWYLSGEENTRTKPEEMVKGRYNKLPGYL